MTKLIIYIYIYIERERESKIKCNKYNVFISKCKIEGENIVKGAIWRGGHYLKLYFSYLWKITRWPQ